MPRSNFLCVVAMHVTNAVLMRWQDAVHKKEVNKMKKKHSQMVKHLKLGIGLAGVCDWDHNNKGVKQSEMSRTHSKLHTHMPV